MDITVDVSWQRITGWLAVHAPVTAAAIRPPAGEQAIGAVQATVGRRLPDELRAWWALMDGIAEPDYRAGFPIPTHYLPLPLEEACGWHAGLARFTDAECCAVDGTHAAAGDSTFGFCPATVPICRDLAGDVLVVDLRDGPRHGCVMSWTAEDGYDGTGWAGTGAMLADTAARLDAGTQVEDGAVRWR